jgi:putative spermidine/putrescine transport system permease protein
MKTIKRAMALVGIVLFILPFVYLLLLSFTNNWKFPKLLPVSYTNKNWQEALLENNGILYALFMSLLIAFFVASISTILGFFISRAIAHHKRRNLLLFACYFPLALSPVIFALIVNYFFIRIGLSGTVAGIVIAQLMIALPFGILLLNSFWNHQINSLEEVSNTLGANFNHTFIKVLLPVAKPQLLVCFIQTFLISWFEYGLTTIIGVGKIKTLTLKVYQYIGEANVYYAAISSCIIILPIVVLIWINKRFIYHKLD